MVMFKWHSQGSDSCFNCMKWNGRIFPSLEKVPELPVHPNCQCVIEAIQDPKVEQELKDAGKELERLDLAATQALKTVESYNLSSWFNSQVLAAVGHMKEEIQKFVRAIEIFKRNREDMIKGGYDRRR